MMKSRTLRVLIHLSYRIFIRLVTLDTLLLADYLPYAPAPLPVNAAGVWDQYGYNRGGLGTGLQQVATLGGLGGRNYDANAYRDQNGYYLGGAGLRNGYDVGKTYGGGRDYGVTGVQGGAYGDSNGRNKGHQVAGFSTNYQKNENGNKATYYDDGLGHGGVVQYGLRDQRYRDGAGNAYGGGVHDSTLRKNAAGNQGQFGNAGGYRNTDNRGGTYGNVDLYQGGLVQGGGVGGGYVGPIASPPVLIQQTVPVISRSLPVAPVAGVGAGPAFSPGPPYNALPAQANPYAMPLASRTGYQNVLVAAV